MTRAVLLRGWTGFAAAMLAAGLTGAADAQVPVLAAQLNPANSKTYILLGQSNWTQARARAIELGGHLATIRSAAENAYVYNTFSNFGGQNRNLWIGLHDLDPASNSTDRTQRRLEFGWQSGESVVYSNWSGVEPNNPNSPEPGTWELYVHIWQPGDSNRQRWNNYLDGTVVFNVPLHGVVEACLYAPVMPSTSVVCPSGTVEFSVAPVGAGPFTYQWQVEDATAPGGWSNIADGPLMVMGQNIGTFAGAASDHGRWDGNYAGGRAPAFWINSGGHFRCTVSNACGSVRSDPARLIVCPADINCSGGVGVQDIFDYLGAYFSGNPIGDFNGVDGVSIQDIFDFLVAYFAGC